MEDSTMNDSVNYCGYIFFDPELRRGLASNAARFPARAPSTRANSKPLGWFKKTLETIGTRYPADRAWPRRYKIEKARSELQTP